MTAAHAAADRQRAIAGFYAAHAEQLGRAVARRVNAPAATIEDALQSAWAILLEHTDVRLDHDGLRWLTTVAIREGWRLAAATRALPVGAFPRLSAGEASDAGIEHDPPGDAPDPADQAASRDEHARRAAALGGLSPRERRELYLQALGYSYHEIAALSWGKLSSLRSSGVQASTTCRRRSFGTSGASASSSVCNACLVDLARPDLADPLICRPRATGGRRGERERSGHAWGSLLGSEDLPGCEEVAEWFGGTRRKLRTMPALWSQRTASTQLVVA